MDAAATKTYMGGGQRRRLAVYGCTAAAAAEGEMEELGQFTVVACCILRRMGMGHGDPRWWGWAVQLIYVELQ